MLDSKDEQIAKKSLAYLVRFDMARVALTAMGATSKLDKTKLSSMVYENVTKDKKQNSRYN